MGDQQQMEEKPSFPSKQKGSRGIRPSWPNLVTVKNGLGLNTLRFVETWQGEIPLINGGLLNGLFMGHSCINGVYDGICFFSSKPGKCLRWLPGRCPEVTLHPSPEHLWFSNNRSKCMGLVLLISVHWKHMYINSPSAMDTASIFPRRISSDFLPRWHRLNFGRSRLLPTAVWPILHVGSQLSLQWSSLLPENMYIYIYTYIYTSFWVSNDYTTSLAYSETETPMRNPLPHRTGQFLVGSVMGPPQMDGGTRPMTPHMLSQEEYWPQVEKILGSGFLNSSLIIISVSGPNWGTNIIYIRIYILRIEELRNDHMFNQVSLIVSLVWVVSLVTNLLTVLGLTQSRLPALRCCVTSSRPRQCRANRPGTPQG